VLFSILIPSYNRPGTIRKTIKSIFLNTNEDFEIIISDDKSPKVNEIKNVLSEFKEYKKLTCYYQETNLGEPDNKNFLVSKAQGEYLIFLGDDDILQPEALECLSNYINKDPEVSLFTFGYTIIDEFDNIIYSRYSPIGLNIGIRFPGTLSTFYAGSIMPLWFFHPATFCCKRRVEKKYRYRNDVGIGEDFMFLFELVNGGHDIKVIPKSLFQWRKVQYIKKYDSQLNQSLEYSANVRSRLKILEKLKSMDLNGEVYKILSTRKYKNDFLYDQIPFDMASSNETRYITQDVKSKVIDNKYKNILFPLVFKRVISYLNITGFLGVYQILSIIFNKTRYKFESKYRID
jgi:glycosyltransferase involved in cell wall biosynthesis